MRADDGLPADVAQWLDQPRYEERGDVAVERGAIHTALASVGNGNPLFWDDEVASVLTGGLVAPPTTLSTWYRPHPWAPGRSTPRLPLQVHFDLKDRLALPEAVIADNRLVFHRPLRLGEVVTTRQRLRSVSDVKQTRLGCGRFWQIDVEVLGADGSLVGVETYTGFGYRRPAAAAPGPGGSGGGDPAAVTDAGQQDSDAASDQQPNGAEDERRQPVASSVAEDRHEVPALLWRDVEAGASLPEVRAHVTATTVVLGALASRDWRPMHHDRDFAVRRNGMKDIFLNTPSQAAWLERLVTDWTGPHGRLGRLRFQMTSSIFPGDDMVLRATVTRTWQDELGCGWVALALEVAVDGRVCTAGDATVAVPLHPQDNPWARSAADADWQP
jgi:acyl dehydratase